MHYRLIACLALLLPTLAGGAELRLSPGDSALQDQLATVPPGSRVTLASGTYAGPLQIEQPMTLLGETRTVIDGGAQGRVITVDAPDVVIRGLTIINSGISLAEEDSGIFVTSEGDRALIEQNTLRDNLIGVYLKGPEQAVVRDNQIEGRRDLRRNERGNGVHLWNTPGSVVEHNSIRYGRDGIFVTTSQHNRFHANRFEDLRFAIHYMYTHDSEVSANFSTGNNSGYALMFSDRLIVRNNVSVGDRERGIFLNFANSSEISANLVRGDLARRHTDLARLVQEISAICGDANHLIEPTSLSIKSTESAFSDKAEAGSCVFMYNANMNQLLDNRFEGCEIGIHFTAGSERNQISGNAFIDNRTQVKYVGTRSLEWSLDGRGNFWSDNVSFDLNGDGIADQPYRPNDLADQLLWRYPQAKLLLNSPALQVLSWAQSQFPSLHPGGVVDSAPLLHDPQSSTTQ